MSPCKIAGFFHAAILRAPAGTLKHCIKVDLSDKDCPRFAGVQSEIAKPFFPFMAGSVPLQTRGAKSAPPFHAFLPPAETFYHRKIIFVFPAMGTLESGPGNVILIPDPVYPVYVDTNIMCGNEVTYLPGNAENDFLPMPDRKQHADIIYLCSPNNPTGACYNKEQLTEWVDYALANDAVILFDSAYEAFVSEPELPRSIYAIEGARKCAIEFCSLSKTAGFTGTRCGYTVVPKELVFTASTGAVMSLNAMWNRRQCTKFNGTSYIVQKGAELVFSEEGIRECQENIDCYRKNAKAIADTLTELGIRFFGGINSPYIWFECPNGMDSWSCFDYLLEHIQVVGTPGAGFGENGKNYFRLTAFGTYEKTVEAMERFKKLFSR